MLEMPSFWSIVVLLLLHQQIVIEALPASLLKHIELNDKNNKVKRTTSVEKPTEIISSNLNNDVPYFRKPTKRNQPLLNIKNPSIDEQNLNDWQQSLNNRFADSSTNFDNIQSPLFNDDNDKSIADYEKGYQYGINKEKLDEALENAILKSELYGDQSAVNQYRYFGGEDKKRKRRRRRNANLKIRKREAVDLTPEQVLAILSFYETQRSKLPLYYDTNKLNDNENNDENWLSRPVAPHASIDNNNDILFNKNTDLDNNELPYNNNNNYYYYYNKRFKVARKRINMDPTRELHYWSQQQFGNDNNKNDYYTLAQLLSHQQKAPLHQEVPVYQRLLL